MYQLQNNGAEELEIRYVRIILPAADTLQGQQALLGSLPVGAKQHGQLLLQKEESLMGRSNKEAEWSHLTPKTFSWLSLSSSHREQNTEE